jgi:hypothetical protein
LRLQRRDFQGTRAAGGLQFIEILRANNHAKEAEAGKAGFCVSWGDSKQQSRPRLAQKAQRLQQKSPCFLRLASESKIIRAAAHGDGCTYRAATLTEKPAHHKKSLAFFVLCAFRGKKWNGGGKAWHSKIGLVNEVKTSRKRGCATVVWAGRRNGHNFALWWSRGCARAGKRERARLRQ